MDISSNVQALSALDVAALAAADNIANSSTENYRPVRADLEDGAGGRGVRVADVVELSSNAYDAYSGSAVAPASRATDGGGDEGGTLRPGATSALGSGADIARDMVDLIQVDRAYSANLAAIGAQDGMTGRILDIKA